MKKTAEIFGRFTSFVYFCPQIKIIAEMEATLTQPQKMAITLPPGAYQTLESVAEAQHVSVNKLVQDALIEMAEDIEDAAIYRYLCETDPEGQEPLSDEEQVEFLKELGL